MKTEGVRCVLLFLGLRLSGNMPEKLQRIQEQLNVMPVTTAIGKQLLKHQLIPHAHSSSTARSLLEHHTLTPQAPPLYSGFSADPSRDSPTTCPRDSPTTCACPSRDSPTQSVSSCQLQSVGRARNRYGRSVGRRNGDDIYQY